MEWIAKGLMKFEYNVVTLPHARDIVDINEGAALEGASPTGSKPFARLRGWPNTDQACNCL